MQQQQHNDSAKLLIFSRKPFLSSHSFDSLVVGWGSTASRVVEDRLNGGNLIM
jgi:hypothetical protein